MVASVLGYVVMVTGLLLIGRVVTFPDEEKALTPADGGIGAATHMLVGRHGGTDFLVDYASARALLHHRDAYALSADTTAAVGEPWAISGANPHPPTLLALVAPFALVRYTWAMAAWSFAMVLVFLLTARFAGVSWLTSAIIASALALTFPGAYGIGNPVPLIGLGAVLAYRFRHEPLLASIGIALAVAPKVSGVLLAVPFLLVRRWRTVCLGAVWLAMLAAGPIVLQRDVWSRYLDAGVSAAKANADRNDNGSFFKLADKAGLPSSIVVIGLAVAVLALVAVRREMFAPVIWVMVAGLPIAWMYSLVTLLPLAVIYALRGRTAVRVLVVVATVLMLASPPSGQWPVVMFPVVVGLFYLAVLLDDGPIGVLDGSAGRGGDAGDVGSLPSWVPLLPSRTVVTTAH